MGITTNSENSPNVQNVQKQLKALQDQVVMTQMNAIKAQAHMEAKLQAALSELQAALRLVGETGGSNAYVKVSTVWKSVAALVFVVYCQKTLSSGRVSKLSYTKAMRHIHLLMGVGVVGGVASVRMAKWSEGTEKQMLMDVHKGSGVVTLAALLLRIVLRLRSPVPERFPGPKVLQISETLSHYLFYLVMLALPSSGLVYTYFNGNGIPFFGLAKGNMEDEDMETAQTAINVHNMLGRFVAYGWMPFHFATLAYHSSKGRSVLKRITPFP